MPAAKLAALAKHGLASKAPTLRELEAERQAATLVVGPELPKLRPGSGLDPVRSPWIGLQDQPSVNVLARIRRWLGGWTS